MRNQSGLAAQSLLLAILAMMLVLAFLREFCVAQVEPPVPNPELKLQVEAKSRAFRLSVLERMSSTLRLGTISFHAPFRDRELGEIMQELDRYLGGPDAAKLRLTRGRLRGAPVSWIFKLVDEQAPAPSWRKKLPGTYLSTARAVIAFHSGHRARALKLFNEALNESRKMSGMAISPAAQTKGAADEIDFAALTVLQLELTLSRWMRASVEIGDAQDGSQPVGTRPHGLRELMSREEKRALDSMIDVVKRINQRANEKWQAGLRGGSYWDVWTCRQELAALLAVRANLDDNFRECQRQVDDASAAAGQILAGATAEYKAGTTTLETLSEAQARASSASLASIRIGRSLGIQRVLAERPVLEELIQSWLRQRNEYSQRLEIGAKGSSRFDVLFTDLRMASLRASMHLLQKETDAARNQLRIAVALAKQIADELRSQVGAGQLTIDDLFELVQLLVDLQHAQAGVGDSFGALRIE